MATEITEPGRMLPVVDEVDVCVVGGSCTGVFAAVAAARMGCRVALVELNGFFGGVATAGLVSIWHSLFDTKGETRIIGGLTQEVLDRLQRRSAVKYYEPTNPDVYAVLNTNELVLELDRLVDEHTIRPFLHTRFCAPVVEDGELTAIAIEDKTGRRAIRARFFIDATGDGDLIARLGLSYRKLDNVQPPTLCAVIKGLRELKAKHPDFHLARAVCDPDNPRALQQGFLWSVPRVGAAELEMVAGTRAHNADCSDADQLTHATIECRKQVRMMIDILREDYGGGDAVSLQGLASYIGIRETRHVDCNYTLTETDALRGVNFEDAIGYGSYRVDVHYSDRPGLIFRYLDGREVYVEPGKAREVERWRPEGEDCATYYQIPYRSLVPKGEHGNVLVAGRLIDADRGAYGAIRVMVNCNQTGHAAGIAAALALSEKVSAADVETGKLRNRLKEQGGVIL